MHISGTLESGHPGNITCAVPWACEQGTPPTFSWIGANPTSALRPETPRSSLLAIILQPRDHGTNLTCRVALPGAGVTVERTVQLNVSCECRPGHTGPREERRQGLGIQTLFWGMAEVR